MNPDARVRCHACGARTEPAADSCDVCGVAQVRLCSACQGPLSVYATTCPGCGSAHRPRRYKVSMRWMTIAVPLAILAIVGTGAVLLVPTETDLDAARRLLTPGSRDTERALAHLEAAAAKPDAPLEALVLRAETGMRRLRAGSGLSRIKARSDLAAIHRKLEELVADRGETPELTVLLARCSFAAGDEAAAILRLRELSRTSGGLPEDASLLLARARWRRGDRTVAMELLLDLAESAEHPETLAEAVETADRRGEPELGDRILTRARKRFPGSPIPGRLDAYRLLDRKDEAPLPDRDELEKRLQADPEDPLPLLLLADRYRRDGDRKREIEALTKAIHLRPGLPRLRLDRAEAHLRCGWPDAALADISQAKARGASHADVLPLLARASLAGPAPDPALAIAALTGADDDPTLLPIRIRALGLVGRPGEAVALAGRAAGRLSGVDLPLLVATELAGIPTPAATELAKKLVDGVLAADPKHPRAKFLRALLADRWEDLHAVLAEDPRNAPARRFLFDRLLEKDPKRARTLAREAEEIDANSPTARYLRGRLLLLDRDPDGAVAAFRAVLAAEPRDREAAEGLRVALSQAGPTGEDARLEGRLRDVEADLRAGEFAAALSRVREWQAEAIDAGPVGRPSEVAAKILYQGGVAAEELRNLEPAKDLYRASIRQRPDHYPALNNLALLLVADPKTATEALRLAERAARLAPGLAEVKDTLGTARLGVGNTRGAVAAYRAALDLFARRGASANAQRAETLVGLARAYRTAGNKAAAEAALVQAAAADPEIRKSADWPQAGQNR